MPSTRSPASGRHTSPRSNSRTNAEGTSGGGRGTGSAGTRARGSGRGGGASTTAGRGAGARGGRESTPRRPSSSRRDAAAASAPGTGATGAPDPPSPSRLRTEVRRGQIHREHPSTYQDMATSLPQSKRARIEKERYDMEKALQCGVCQTTTFSSDRLGEAAPIQSQICGHSFCLGCVTKMHLARLEDAGRRPVRWIDCPICKRKKAFDPADPHFNLALLAVCEVLESKGSTAGDAAESSGRDANRNADEVVVADEGIDTTDSKAASSVEILTDGISDNASEEGSPKTGETSSSSSGQLEQRKSQINKEDFLSRRVFHLNPFIDAEAKTNWGFGPFIAAGGAMIGFADETSDYLHLDSQGMADDEIRKALKDSSSVKYSPRVVSQVSMWQTQVRVGDFIVMRHEYGASPSTPERLVARDGSYLGPVFVIGVVTHPPSSDYTDILEVMEKNDFSERYLKAQTYCRVEFCRMGYKKDLEESTQSYLGKVCQPTIAHICQVGRVWTKLETDSERVRADLWNKSTISISKDDFIEFKV